MQSQEKDNLIFARFFPQEDIYDCLKALLAKHQVKTAVVLSGIGQIKDVTLGFFKEKGDYLPQNMREPLELLSLSGNMSLDYAQSATRNEAGRYDFHIHAVLGDKEKKALGGHLINGKVSVTLEIVLLKTNMPVTRKIEEETGLKGMFLE